MLQSLFSVWKTRQQPANTSITNCSFWNHTTNRSNRKWQRFPHATTTILCKTHCRLYRSWRMKNSWSLSMREEFDSWTTHCKLSRDFRHRCPNFSSRFDRRYKHPAKKENFRNWRQRWESYMQHYRISREFWHQCFFYLSFPIFYSTIILIVQNPKCCNDDKLQKS